MASLSLLPQGGRRCSVGADEGVRSQVLFGREWLRAYPHPNPSLRPGPRLRRGRSKAHAPVARKPCLLAPRGEGLHLVTPVRVRVCHKPTPSQLAMY
ncbi:hypothetical protein XspCFBP7912_14225 [Xanthomonas sp. CFBP 7912]|nr:hypothetical protein XspCFBP7912_14225 [Xanthomonas sp. CFBP 7912]RJS03887.1 hypothetical protein XnspCFBP7698_12290 [Xanthomonas sp. CFBP 7698]